MKAINDNIKPLTKVELKKLTNVLDVLEEQTKKDTYVFRFSGGFAEAEMFNYDNDIIDIELNWGIQNDGENSTHTEQWKLDRKTFLFID